ncbi:MAG TPA: alpha/beta hydrolase [Candidatus Limnocylindrales bacterium]|nr:alpha/beta hydrolase [Candidatus Limnocylindrales bacterium]
MRLVEISNGVEIAVEEAGTGRTVVLLHGWPVTAYHWRHTIPVLAAAGLRAITVELRGLGASSSHGGPFDKEVLAGDVVRLLDRLAVASFAVVGHDWGGTVGYLLAADLPGRVTALAVEEEMLPGIGAVVPEPGARYYPSWHGPFLRAPGLAEALVPGREDAFYGTFLGDSAGPEPLADDAVATYLAAYRRPSALEASVGYYRTASADAEAVRRRAAKPLAIPVLTVGGEFGMGRAVAASFGAVADHVEHRQVAGAGHYPAEQQPDVVNDALVRLLTTTHADGSQPT